MATTSVRDNGNRSDAIQGQSTYTIHTDVQIAWRRKLCDIQLLPQVFATRGEAIEMLNTVRHSNPRAFIKTKTIRAA